MDIMICWMYTINAEKDIGLVLLCMRLLSLLHATHCVCQSPAS